MRFDLFKVPDDFFCLSLEKLPVLGKDKSVRLAVKQVAGQFLLKTAHGHAQALLCYMQIFGSLRHLAGLANLKKIIYLIYLQLNLSPSSARHTAHL